MTLLLDLGNTRLKWARMDLDGQLAPVQATPWDALDDDDALKALCSGIEAGSTVLAASVAGRAREERVARALQAGGLAAPSWLRSPAAACGVRNAYPEPGNLGVDRFLGLVAALHAGLAPCVVVSAGTALTLDALAGDGRHLGGLIAPGPRLMQLSLRSGTAQLPDPGAAPVVDCADNTEAAIASGCWQAALGLIERFHARMTGPLGGRAGLVLAGGDGKALAAWLPGPVTLQADAVLQGLAIHACQASA
jgi:type III pantothenate kinase